MNLTWSAEAMSKPGSVAATATAAGKLGFQSGIADIAASAAGLLLAAGGARGFAAKLPTGCAAAAPELPTGDPARLSDTRRSGVGAADCHTWAQHRCDVVLADRQT